MLPPEISNISFKKFSRVNSSVCSLIFKNVTWEYLSLFYLTLWKKSNASKIFRKLIVCNLWSIVAQEGFEPSISWLWATRGQPNSSTELYLLLCSQTVVSCHYPYHSYQLFAFMHIVSCKGFEPLTFQHNTGHSNLWATQQKNNFTDCSKGKPDLSEHETCWEESLLLSLTNTGITSY